MEETEGEEGTRGLEEGGGSRVGRGVKRSKWTRGVEGGDGTCGKVGRVGKRGGGLAHVVRQAG